MTIDNIIFINGGTYNNIKKALRQWMKAYSDNLPDDLIFELYKNGRGKHIIKADERLDNWLFYFLINYLNYPEGIEHKVDIEGFKTGKNDDVLKNEKLLVYISPYDEDGDNVYVTTSSNKNYKIDFAVKISQANETKPYRLPVSYKIENPDIIKINKREISKKREQKSKKTAEKQFKIITLLIATVFIINLIIQNIPNEMDFFKEKAWVILFGVGIWFLMDHEMLGSDSFFFKSLLIAFGVLCYGYFICKYYKQPYIHIILACSFYPLMVLAVQWPTRKTYKAIYKCEPEFGARRNFAEVLYDLILALLPIFLILLIINYFF